MVHVYMSIYIHIYYVHNILGVMNFLITYVYNEDPSKISADHGCYQGTEPHSRPQGRNHF